jgi:predicted dehydrogenase
MTLRGGLVGCGYISQEQLAAWRNVAGAEIVAVCDLEVDKARQRAQAFGIPAAYADYDRMLAEQALDFVDLATRPDTHLELVRAAAASGRHVLCQKPVAGDLEQARAMIAACEAAGVCFMVNENFRFQAWFRRLKALLDSGALGTPHLARFHGRWRATLPAPDFNGQPYFQAMPRLIVYELGVHYLDTARYLFGEAESVYARLQRVSAHIAGEDLALLCVNFDGLTCVVDTNWFAVPEPAPRGVTMGTLVVEGAAATAVLSGDGKLTLHTGGEAQAWSFPADTAAQGFVAAQQHFVDCVRAGATPETDGWQTLRTMALVFAAYRSAQEERVVLMSEFDLGQPAAG